MPLTDPERQRGARRLARLYFEEPVPPATANLDLEEIIAALDFIDASMSADLSTLPPTLSMTQVLVQGFPEPFKARTTTAQKSNALATWALLRGGAL